MVSRFTRTAEDIRRHAMAGDYLVLDRGEQEPLRYQAVYWSGREIAPMAEPVATREEAFRGAERAERRAPRMRLTRRQRIFY
jgi:hypothetical protein